MVLKSHFTICLLVAAVAWLPTGAFADSPRQFLSHALKGDNSEIMLGHVAQDQGRSSNVRDFGRTLVADHSEARDEVIRTGQRMGIKANRDVAPEAREEREKLAHLRGSDFDREFARYMVEDHRKDISDFTEEAQEGHGAVSNLAQRQLPTLRKHLNMAIALDSNRGQDRRGFDGRENGDRKIDRDDQRNR
jgi:putative membrane protein